MKINNIVVLLFLIIIYTIKAQVLKEQEKQEIINSLSIVTDDSIGTDHYAPYAIERIIEDEIKEAEPAIIENIWKQDPYTQTRFLYALRILGSERLEELTLAYIDSVDHYPEDEYFTKLELKVLVLRNLFVRGNFTHYQLVYDRLEEDWDDACGEVVGLLYYIAKGIPGERERAKRELMKIAENANDYFFRFYAIDFLQQIYDQEMIPFFIERFKLDESSDIRYLILTEVFVKYKDLDISKVLTESLTSEPDATVRERIVEELIEKYQNPSNYEIIKTYVVNENDKTTRNLVNFLLRDNKPRPDPTETPLSMIDSLISYNNQCYNLGWIQYYWVRDINYYQLNNAKMMINMGYLASAEIILQAYENWINTVKSLAWINEDAYRFLYYYSVYLRERLKV